MGAAVAACRRITQVRATLPRRDRLARVVVDFTPLVAGGANGGAKPMTVELVRGIGQLASQVEFILLTSPSGHDELASLDAPNIHRLQLSATNVPALVAPPAHAQATPPERPVRLRRHLYRAFTLHLPHRAVYLIDRSYGLTSRFLRSLRRPIEERRTRGATSLVSQLNGDVLFCPFTAPYFRDPSVPTVALVHDVQYRRYPGFFAPEDRQGRERDFRRAVAEADLLTCTSDFVRSTILEAAPSLPPDRVVAIYPRLAHRLPAVSSTARAVTLAQFGLTDGNFLLYPANFWRHKNHEMLLMAFAIHRAAHPDSTLRLVCTGEHDDDYARFARATRRMALADWVVAPGYVPQETLSALFDGCAAVIFPSLYEGFGLPVLEAMAHDVPVICSAWTSLPEVAGDAALYFDPRSPTAIARAIERVTIDRTLASHLVQAGRAHLAGQGTSDDAASAYLELFCRLQQQAVARRRRRRRLPFSRAVALA
jgi:glycosyltransferase involved in cell wall biosynthesis